jgi:peptidoglycan/LPS O-acetylase OafA/YrhL
VPMVINGKDYTVVSGGSQHPSQLVVNTFGGEVSEFEILEVITFDYALTREKMQVVFRFMRDAGVSHDDTVVEDRGCWLDDDQDRTMSIRTNDGADFEACKRSAIAQNMPAFALQNGDECWLGDAEGYKRIGPSPDSCEEFGGPLINHVHEIVPTPSPTPTPTPLSTPSPTPHPTRFGCPTVYLYDSVGDGWQGATLQFTAASDQSVVYLGIELNVGSYGSLQLCDLIDACYRGETTAGAYPDEVSWALQTADGTAVAEGQATQQVDFCLFGATLSPTLAPTPPWTASPTHLPTPPTSSPTYSPTEVPTPSTPLPTSNPTKSFSPTTTLSPTTEDMRRILRIFTGDDVRAIGSVFAWFNSDSLSVDDATTWPESSGANLAAATCSGCGVVISSGNGLLQDRVVLSGPASAWVDFGNIIPQQPEYTVCSATRYRDGEANGRLLNGDGANWVHGHWGGRPGVAFYEGWLNGYEPRVSPVLEWVFMCAVGGSNGDPMVVNGKEETVSGGGSGWPSRVMVNAGIYGNEVSSFEVLELITFDRKLTAAEMIIVYEYMSRIDVTSSPTGTPTPAPSALCVCEDGYARPVDQPDWRAHCVSVPCPIHAVHGDSGLCSCSDGYSGFLTWDSSMGSYSGHCVLSPCPALPKIALSFLNLSAPLAPQCADCPPGFSSSTVAWSRSNGGHWIGHCSIEFCPKASSRVAVDTCKCDPGYVSRGDGGAAGPMWSYDPPSWSGYCDLVPCPANSHRPLMEAKCVCDMGFVGAPAWDSNNARWYQADPCVKVACPSGSHRTERGDCACGARVEDWLEFDSQANAWRGDCYNTTLAGIGKSFRLPQHHHANPATTATHKLAVTVSALILVAAALHKYSGYAWFKKKVHSSLSDPPQPGSDVGAGIGGGIDPGSVNAAPGDPVPMTRPERTDDEDEDRTIFEFERQGSFNTILVRSRQQGSGTRSSDLASGSASTASIEMTGIVLGGTNSSSSSSSPHGNASAQYVPVAVMSPEGGGAPPAQCTVQSGVVASPKAADDPFTAREEWHPPSAASSYHADGDAKGESKGAGGELLSALGPARFLASLHVVSGHLVSRTPSVGYSWQSSSWGFTWVPFFMMLSSFILTYSKVSKPNVTFEPIGTFMHKRLRGIYPLYLAGLLSAVALDAYKKQQTPSLGSPLETAAQLLLMQAWIPTITENAFQTQCWFLSAILPLWFCHQTFVKFLIPLRERYLWAMLGFLTFLPWFGLVIVPQLIGEPVLWYEEHEQYSTDTPVDIWVVMIKFHPLFYVSTYLYGMLTAILFVRRRKNPPKIFICGASLGYAMLYELFSWGTLPAAKLSTRIGALAPLHALILVGLSLGDDPLSSLFSHKYVSWMNDVSFPQYVMQFIALTIWDGFGNAGFYVFLLCLAMVACVTVFQPLQNMRSPAKTQALGIMGIVTLPCLCVGLYILFPHPPGGSIELPNTYEHSRDMIDIRLQLGDAGVIPGLDGSSRGSLINPSLFYFGDSLHVAVRQHYLHTTIEKGTWNTNDPENKKVVAEKMETQTWYSYVWTTRLDPDTFEPLEPLTKFDVRPPTKTMDEWLPCLQPPMYVARNQSISVIKSVGGLEDPRFLVRTNGTSGEAELALTFYSNPPRDLAAEKAGTALGPIYGLWYAKLDGGPDWEGLCPSKGRVWMTPSAVSGNAVPPRAVGFERQQGRTFIAEKNWMYFESALQDPLFVTDVEPHTITSATTSASPKLRLVAESITSRLGAAIGDVGAVIHGGANPILIREHVFLGSFHTITSGKYTTYLYEFSALAPYAVLRISTRLPLLEAPIKDASISIPMTFNSGLTQLPDGRVLISYGSSNSESRVLVLTQTGLSDLFAAKDSKVPMATRCRGAWSKWSDCGIMPDGSCGSQRTYSVGVLAARGGDECPFRPGALESRACTGAGACADPVHDVCTLPWHLGVYDSTNCIDDGGGISSSKCELVCAEGMVGAANVTCPGGGKTPFLLSGCVHPGCGKAESCVFPQLPNGKTNVDPNYNISECKSGGTLKDCKVTCSEGYEGEPAVNCYGGIFVLQGCSEVDGCESNPCASGGDHGAVCRDLLPPSSGHVCSACSPGFELVDNECRAMVTCSLSADSQLLRVYYHDKEVTSSVTGDFTYWPSIKQISFGYVKGAVIGVAAFNSAGDCWNGSFWLTCRCDGQHRNPWNRVASWTDLANVRAFGSTTDDAPTYWYTSSYNATHLFKNPCSSDSPRWESDAAHQIWVNGGGQFAYFRVGPVDEEHYL